MRVKVKWTAAKENTQVVKRAIAKRNDTVLAFG